MSIHLTQSQAGIASTAYYHMDNARRFTRNFAHPTDQAVVDKFAGRETAHVDFDQPCTSNAKITFDPKNPIKTSYNAQTMENGYDPSNTGSARVKVDYDNTHSFSTILAPHSHDKYSVSPKGEHLKTRTGLDTITVDVDHSGTWTIQPYQAGFKHGSPLVLENFDDKWKRFDMYTDTTYTPPGPMVGRG